MAGRNITSMSSSLGIIQQHEDEHFHLDSEIEVTNAASIIQQHKDEHFHLNSEIEVTNAASIIQQPKDEHFHLHSEIEVTNAVKKPRPSNIQHVDTQILEDKYGSSKDGKRKLKKRVRAKMVHDTTGNGQQFFKFKTRSGSLLCAPQQVTSQENTDNGAILQQLEGESVAPVMKVADFNKQIRRRRISHVPEDGVRKKDYKDGKLVISKSLKVDQADEVCFERRIRVLEQENTELKITVNTLKSDNEDLEKELRQLYEESNADIREYNKDYQDMIELFECPVCRDYALPPIQQCGNGHIACQSCLTKCSICPTCRIRLENIRNLPMEKIATLLNFPCKFSDNGCSATLLLTEKREHENTCEHRNE